jgi:hypothetical protein
MYPRRYNWKRMLLEYGAAIVVFTIVSAALEGNPRGPLIAIMAMLGTLLLARALRPRRKDADPAAPGANPEGGAPPRPEPSRGFGGGIMGPRRFPGWRRIILEYVAMFLVYVAVMATTKNVVLALVAMIGTMFVGRATRDPGP